MEIINQYYINYANELPTYEEFFNNVMKKNLVCLFNSNLTKNWICRNEWITDDKINFSILSNKYGINMVLISKIFNYEKKFNF